MKLKDLLLEKKSKLSEKKLSDNKDLKKIIEDLKEEPGVYIIQQLQSAISKSGLPQKNTVMSSLYDLFDDIQAEYKKVDAKVADMIDIAISDFDEESLYEKNKQLELIKKHASDIQDSLKVETKKKKKK